MILLEHGHADGERWEQQRAAPRTSNPRSSKGPPNGTQGYSHNRFREHLGQTRTAWPCRLWARGSPAHPQHEPSGAHRAHCQISLLGEQPTEPRVGCWGAQGRSEQSPPCGQSPPPAIGVAVGPCSAPGAARLCGTSACKLMMSACLHISS